MIRYHVSRQDLEGLIDTASKGWRAAAKKKTARFRKAGKYSEKKGTWSAIKQAYIDIQHGKCGYCERKFGTDEKSRIEHDVEHFRPKSAVRAWPPPKGKLRYGFTTGAASLKGYYLLAYNLMNYLIACKKCNSPHKSDYFPIAGKKRACGTEEFEKLAAEQPLLIYPISDLDDDPEKLITFEGYLPLPRARSGHKHRRGRVTIDFFGLASREELLRERALIIKALYVACEDLDHKDKLRRQDAQQTVNQIDKPGMPHRNCARAFYALYPNQKKTARSYYAAAIEYLDSVGYG